MRSQPAVAKRGSPVRALFVIRSLDVGGAERQLITLVKSLDKAKFESAVLTLYAGGKLSRELDSAGVELITLNKKNRWDVFGALWRAFREVRRFAPRIIHGYMPVGNILALMLGKTVHARVIWGIRASNVDLGTYDWLNTFSLRLAAMASRWADLIISNSESGASDHAADGYPHDRMIVIPNGIDVERFYPRSNAKARLRQQWGIDRNAFVIGHVGRLDPMKDHVLLLRAFGELCARWPHVSERVQLVCIGSGSPTYGRSLQTLTARLGLADRVRWIPHAEEPELAYNAIDVLAMTSAFGEGFPNVVAEAMACGIPCVVTDVGDAALLVEGNGVAVPARDASRFAEALYTMLSLPDAERKQRGSIARERIVERYQVRRLLEATTDALQGTL